MSGTCPICREGHGGNICKICKRMVCDECFDAAIHICVECLTHKVSRGVTVIHKHILASAPILILLLGFLLIIIGSFILFISPFQGTKSISGGAIFLLGPIPIILGGGPYAPLLITLALLVTILIIVVWLITGLKTKMS